MKRLAIILITILMTSASFAADLSEKSIDVFLDNWLKAQNSGDFESYAAMYSKKFIGIRRSGERVVNFNRESWLKDRQRMFKNKMKVSAKNVNIKSSDKSAIVNFEQTWESGTFKDAGNKLLDIKLDNKKLKIVHEEMLISRLVLNTAPQGNQRNIKSKSVNTSKLKSWVISLKENDCKSISKKKSKKIDNRELDRSECLAPKNWHLFTVVGGERYWLELVKGNIIWSTENEVVTSGDYRFGNFQSIELEKAEWLIDASGKPISLIFPVVAQDPDTIDKNINRFFVVKFINNKPFFCDVTKSASEANKQAKKQSPCFHELSKRYFKASDNSN